MNCSSVFQLETIFVFGQAICNHIVHILFISASERPAACSRPQLTRGADFTALIAACRRQSSWRQAIGFLQQIFDSSLGCEGWGLPMGMRMDGWMDGWRDQNIYILYIYVCCRIALVLGCLHLEQMEKQCKQKWIWNMQI